VLHVASQAGEGGRGKGLTSLSSIQEGEKKRERWKKKAGSPREKENKKRGRLLHTVRFKGGKEEKALRGTSGAVPGEGGKNPSTRQKEKEKGKNVEMGTAFLTCDGEEENSSPF